MSRHSPRIDLYKSGDEYRWRLWSSSRIIGQSSEGYRQRKRAIENLTAVLGGEFTPIATDEHPAPFGVLVREMRSEPFFQRIPVRWVES